MGEGMSYREMARELVETKDELETLRGKYKTILAKRKELTE